MAREKQLGPHTGILCEKRGAAYPDTALSDPDSRHGDGFPLQVHQVGEFLDVGDVFCIELIERGMAAVRVCHQDDLFRIMWMFSRRSGKGDMGFPKISQVLWPLVGLDIEIASLL